MHFLLVLVQRRSLCCPHSPVLASPVDVCVLACLADTPGILPSAQSRLEASVCALWRPYEIIRCSIDLWLTDSSACGAGELRQMTSTYREILMAGVGGIGGVNIFSTSLVISIFSLSFFSLVISPPHP